LRKTLLPGDGLSKVTNKARLECLRHVGLLRALTDDQREALVPFLQPEQYNPVGVVYAVESS
jgi:hypothetical protein